MANYSAFANGAACGSDKGILCTGSDGTTRMGLYDVIIGSDATPADVATEFVVNRNTDTGTGGTAVTPEPLDPTQPAAKSSATHGAYGTTEPADSSASELLHIALNQRATFRWVAAPGSELWGVIASGDGLFLRSVASGSTPACNATFLFKE